MIVPIDREPQTSGIVHGLLTIAVLIAVVFATAAVIAAPWTLAATLAVIGLVWTLAIAGLAVLEMVDADA